MLHCHHLSPDIKKSQGIDFSSSKKSLRALKNPKPDYTHLYECITKGVNKQLEGGEEGGERKENIFSRGLGLCTLSAQAEAKATFSIILTRWCHYSLQVVKKNKRNTSYLQIPFKYLPCWMTMESSRSFISARSTILSSTVLSVINLNTRTVFVWPILCARS